MDTGWASPQPKNCRRFYCSQCCLAKLSQHLPTTLSRTITCRLIFQIHLCTQMICLLPQCRSISSRPVDYMGSTSWTRDQGSATSAWRRRCVLVVGQGGALAHVPTYAWPKHLQERHVTMSDIVGKSRDWMSAIGQSRQIAICSLASLSRGIVSVEPLLWNAEGSAPPDCLGKQIDDNLRTEIHY